MADVGGTPEVFGGDENTEGVIIIIDEELGEWEAG